MKGIFINKEHVELFKILKFEGIASSGAEAKEMIASGTVKHITRQIIFYLTNAAPD